jgi:hypothetical protein
MLPLLQDITNKGQDGFTFVVDPRMRMRAPDGAVAGQCIGVRLQFVPEIAMRADEAFRAELTSNPDKIADLIAEKTDAMADLASDLQQAEGVLSSHLFRYDSFVMGRENYDEYIEGMAAGGAGAGQGPAWFGQPYRDHVAAANRRLAASGGGGAGNIPESGAPAATGSDEAVSPAARAAAGDADSAKSIDNLFEALIQLAPREDTLHLQGGCEVQVGLKTSALTLALADYKSFSLCITCSRDIPGNWSSRSCTSHSRGSAESADGAGDALGERSELSLLLFEDLPDLLTGTIGISA